MAKYLTVAEIRAAFGTLDRVADTQREDAERMTLLSVREVEAFRALAQEEADALRARLADVERERDALQRHYDAAAPEYNLFELLDGYHGQIVRLRSDRNACGRERDDARRVAKRLALCGEYFHNDDLPAWMDAQKTALAYEVEP